MADNKEAEVNDPMITLTDHVPTVTLTKLIEAMFEPLLCPILSQLECIESRLYEIDERLHRINHKVNQLLGMELGDARRDKVASKNMERVLTEVSENRDAVASIETLVQGLAQQIRDNLGNEEALGRVADEIDANTSRIAKAVTDNTPFTPSGQ